MQFIKKRRCKNKLLLSAKFKDNFEVRLIATAAEFESNSAHGKCQVSQNSRDWKPFFLF